MKVMLSALLLLCFSHINNVYAQSAAINIRIVAPELKPLIYQNEQGKASGLFVDSLTKVQNETHLHFDIQVVPWARAMQLAINNHADAIMPVLYTKERALSLVFPQHELINFYGSVIIKRQDDAFDFNGFDALQTSKRIAKVRAVSLGQEFDSAVSNPLIKLTEVTKLEDAFNMLLLQRVDLVVSDGIVADEVIEAMALGDKLIVKPISNIKEASYLAFSRQFSKTHDINALMAIINKFNDPDYYQKRLTVK